MNITSTEIKVVFHRTSTKQLIQRYQSICTQFSRYILRGILSMICNLIARKLFSFKRLQVGYTAVFQRNVELELEYILDLYGFFE